MGINKNLLKIFNHFDERNQLKKYKNAKVVIPAKQLQQKVNNLIKTFNN